MASKETLAVKVECPACGAAHVKPTHADRDDLPDTIEGHCPAPHPARGNIFDGCGERGVGLECLEWREPGGFPDGGEETIIADGGHRHATDLKDGVLIAECPNVDGSGDHLTATVEYERAEYDNLPELFAEAFPECGECGADLQILAQEEQAEVLTDGGETLPPTETPAGTEQIDGEVYEYPFRVTGWDGKVIRDALDTVPPFLDQEEIDILASTLTKALGNGPVNPSTFDTRVLKHVLAKLPDSEAGRGTLPSTVSGEERDAE